MTRRPRPHADTSRSRRLLAALLLTVLTLAGGTATAGGTAVALPTAGSTAAMAASAASAPQAGGPVSQHRAGDRTGPGTGYRAGQGAGPGSRHIAVQDHRGPDHAHGAVAAPGTGAVTRAGHEHPAAAADPAQAPRAGSGRPYLLLHAPPPPHDALTPAAPGPAAPRGGVRQSAAGSFDVPGSRGGSLPGVRGPPGRITGPTTGPPSRTADPASRPH
ncbi:hypothetical protein ACIODW_01895 [Streptomyces sp. NPDC087897]|uniref:hypothetical protein n=1 Tax=Streptomyces sp. NPDC087897 TaxID=3365817 RepID=UPI00381623A5